MADMIRQQDYDWAPVVGEHGHIIGARAWDEGGRGWVLLFFRDHMRREEIVSATFIQSYTHWNSGTKTDPKAPVAITLDLEHVKYTDKSGARPHG